MTVQAGLGLALMGGLLTAACGDESRADRAIDSPAGERGHGGQARRLRRGSARRCGRRWGARHGGAPGTGGARPSGESPPPRRGGDPLDCAALGGPAVDESADVPLAGGRRRRRGDGRALRRPRLHLLSSSRFAATGAARRRPPRWPRATSSGACGRGTATSATWEAFIPHRTAAPSAALATRPDYDGDGFGDFVLDDRVMLGGPSGYARSFPLPRPTPAADASFFVQAGDLNGDGFGDILRLDASDELTPVGILTPDAPLRRARPASPRGARSRRRCRMAPSTSRARPAT